MISPSSADIGRSVVYIPGHAQGDRTHTDCEHGVLTNFSTTSAFVRFGNDHNPKGCYFWSLEWEFPTKGDT